MKKIKPTYWLLLIVLMFSFRTTADKEMGNLNKEPDSNEKLIYNAGEEIILKFDKKNTTNPLLYFSSSYGNSLLTPIEKNGFFHFTFPAFIYNKIGVINWELLDNNKSLEKGIITIKPSRKVTEIETYFGPTFMQAGDLNIGHLVSIPVDSLDNPIEKMTPVIVNQQFKNKVESTEIETSNLIAFKKIVTRYNYGMVSLNSECEQISSKELSLEIHASTPINYKIKAKTNHNFADGNQIAFITTSPITDKYENIIVDGTFVKFIIKNKNGYLLHANATTINGVATAKINHPKEKDIWTIQSFIQGMAESNTIQINFSPSIKDCELIFSDRNRNLSVGPIKSYMNQIMPDGFEINIRIIKNNKIIKKIKLHSLDGIGKYTIKKREIEAGRYDFELEIGGIKKLYKSIKI